MSYRGSCGETFYTYTLIVYKLPKAFNTRLSLSIGYWLEVNETQIQTKNSNNQRNK